MSGKVLNKCKENHWDYIIRYKEGSAPSIEREYESIPEKNVAGNADFIKQLYEYFYLRKEEIKKVQKISTNFKTEEKL